MSVFKTRGLVDTLGYAALFALVALYAYAPIFSVDLFWHLKLGEIIASEAAIPRTDLFSAVRPDRPYVQFQWLWDLAAHAAFRAGGLHGIRLMQVAVLLLSYAVLARVVKRIVRDGALSWCLCCLAVVLFEDRFQTRPSATILGFVALTLPWLWGGHRHANRTSYCLAFMLGALWSNVHGGESLLFVACMGALSVGSLLEWRLEGRTTARDVISTLRLTAFGIAGIICSPTLIPGLLAWARVIGPQIRSGNEEWQSSFSILSHGVNPSTLMVGLCPSLVAIAYAATEWRTHRAHERGSWPWSEWLLCAGLLALAHQAVRNVFLCVVPLSFILSRLDSERLGIRARTAILALGVGILAASFEDHVIEGYGSVRDAGTLVHYDLAPGAFPEELAAFMREAGIQGGILNDGRWGGYLIFQLWPSCHVFVDSRHDLTDDMWPVFMASQSPRARDAALQYAFARWGVELTAFHGPTFAAVRPLAEWQLLYKAGPQELYQHRDGAHAARNMERAWRWLRSGRGYELQNEAFTPERLGREAIQVGAARWLQAPYQRFRADRARALLSSKDPERRYEGLSIQSALDVDAGRYERALATLDEMLSQRPDDPVALYRALLASLAISDLPRAISALTRIKGHLDGLTPHQIGRLAAIDRVLANPETK